MNTPFAITPATTINDAILLHPEILSVLKAAGLDACCGGSLAIAEAAKRHGLNEQELLNAIHAAITTNACSCAR